MTFGTEVPSMAGGSAAADPTITSVSVFATGAPVGGTGPEFDRDRRRVDLGRIRQHGRLHWRWRERDRPIQSRRRS